MSKLNIVMYYYVRDLKAEIRGLDYNFFQEPIEWLKKNFELVKIEDAPNFNACLFYSISISYGFDTFSVGIS